MPKACKSSWVTQSCRRPFCLPICIRDLPFAVSETTDTCIDGLYWTAVAGADKGIAVFNRGTMDAVREQDGGFSIPLAYASYYIWGARMLSGDFEYEFALYPFAGAWSAAGVLPVRPWQIRTIKIERLVE